MAKANNEDPTVKLGLAPGKLHLCSLAHPPGYGLLTITLGYPDTTYNCWHRDGARMLKRSDGYRARLKGAQQSSRRYSRAIDLSPSNASSASMPHGYLQVSHAMLQE
jgi:hypothetical protein